MEENEVSNLNEFFEELLKKVNDPLHKRILQATLESSNPLITMETELSKYLLEVLNDEN